MENQGQKTLFRRACEDVTGKSAKKAFAAGAKDVLVAGTLAAAFGGCVGYRGPQMGTPLNDAAASNEPQSTQSEPQSDAGFVPKDAQSPSDLGAVSADTQPKQDTSSAFAQDTAVAKDTGAATAVPDAGVEVLSLDAMPDSVPTPGQDAMSACVPTPAGTQSPQPDGGVAPAATYSYTINSLIGDNIDRTLFDRGKGVSTYPLGSDTDVNANPFTDGTGTGTLGPTDTSLYRITGDMFPPFATASIPDVYAATSYQEQQNVWMSGNSHYSDAANTIVGTFNSVSYTVKLSGASDDFGIPVCTATCTTDDQTATHRVAIPFLGANWLITGMTPPTTPLTSETLLASGGSVTLAQEAAHSLLSGVGPNPTSTPLSADNALSAGNIRFVLVSVDSTNGTATVSAVDMTACKEMIRQTIQVGTTEEIEINGTTYLLHVWKIAPGYTFGAQWAEVSLFSKEVKLMSGELFDQDNGANPNWTVYLGWKNQGASTIDTNPNHLRSMILYYGVGNGGQDMKPGDYLNIAQNPATMQLQYFGLSDSASLLTPLTFDLERDSNLTVDVQVGQDVQSCIVSAPYVHVVSAGSGPVFTVNNMQGANGTASVSGNEFYVATSGALCAGSIAQLVPGALFMPGSSMAYLDYAPFSAKGGVVVKYPYAGATVAGSTFGPGTITYENENVPSTVLPPGVADFVFTVGEDAGIALSEPSPIFSQFGLKLNGTSSTFSYNAPASNGDLWFEQGTIVSCGAGPVTTPNALSGCLLPSPGPMFRSPGYTDDRGSEFFAIGETTVQLSTATQLVYSQFVLNSLPKK